jgi:hypothetical protein
MDGSNKWSDSVGNILKCCATPIAALMLLSWFDYRALSVFASADIDPTAKIILLSCAWGFYPAVALLITVLAVKWPHRLTFDKDAHIRFTEINVTNEGPAPYQRIDVQVTDGDSLPQTKTNHELEFDFASREESQEEPKLDKDE